MDGSCCCSYVVVVILRKTSFTYERIILLLKLNNNNNAFNVQGGGNGFWHSLCQVGLLKTQQSIDFVFVNLRI